MEGKLVLATCLMIFVPFISGDSKSKSSASSMSFGGFDPSSAMKGASKMFNPMNVAMSQASSQAYTSDNGNGPYNKNGGAAQSYAMAKSASGTQQMGPGNNGNCPYKPNNYPGPGNNGNCPYKPNNYPGPGNNGNCPYKPNNYPVIQSYKFVSVYTVQETTHINPTTTVQEIMETAHINPTTTQAAIKEAMAVTPALVLQLMLHLVLNLITKAKQQAGKLLKILEKAAVFLFSCVSHFLSSILVKPYAKTNFRHIY